jgi:hypothetical protein
LSRPVVLGHEGEHLAVALGGELHRQRMGGTGPLGDVNEVVGHIKQIRAKGTGVIGMKMVDAVTIGYKSEAEIDEAIERLNTHLNA